MENSRFRQQSSQIEKENRGIKQVINDMDYRKLEKEIEEWMSAPPNPDIKYGTDMKKERQVFLRAFIAAFLTFLIFIIIVEILGL